MAGSAFRSVSHAEETTSMIDIGSDTEYFTCSVVLVIVHACLMTKFFQQSRDSYF